MTEPNSCAIQSGRNDNQVENSRADEPECRPSPVYDLVPLIIQASRERLRRHPRASDEFVEQRLRELGNDINRHCLRRLACECGVSCHALIRALKTLEAAGKLQIYRSGMEQHQYEWLVPPEAEGTGVAPPVDTQYLPPEVRLASLRQQAKNDAFLARVEPSLHALGSRISELGLHELSVVTTFGCRDLDRALRILENRGMIRVRRGRGRNRYSWIDPPQAGQ